MRRAAFESRMSFATAMNRLQPERADYWAGYMRGLRRAFHGRAFGTDAEHRLWLSLIGREDSQGRERGLGYRDGLTGKEVL
ncbi:MAG: hypothetical protein ACE15E_00570 [Acidobacteriota bacterium]